MEASFSMVRKEGRSLGLLTDDDLVLCGEMKENMR